VKRVVRPKKGKAHQRERDAAYVAMPQKAQQIERLVHFKGKKAQEVRRVEEERAACPEKGKAQQEWRRSTIEELKRRAEKHCEKDVLEEAQFLELGWYMLGMIVTYTECSGCERKRSYAEDDKYQGVLKDRMFWCRCKGKKKEGSAPTERKSTAKEERAAHGQESQKVQQEREVVKGRSGEPLEC